MDDIPVFIVGEYIVPFEINLPELGIDPLDVKRWKLKEHALFITHLDDTVTVHQCMSDQWTYEEMAAREDAEGLEVLDAMYDLAVFPNVLE